MLRSSVAGFSTFVNKLTLLFQPLLAYQVEGELYLKVNNKGIKNNTAIFRLFKYCNGIKKGGQNPPFYFYELSII